MYIVSYGYYDLEDTGAIWETWLGWVDNNSEDWWGNPNDSSSSLSFWLGYDAEAINEAQEAKLDAEAHAYNTLCYPEP